MQEMNERGFITTRRGEKRYLSIEWKNFELQVVDDELAVIERDHGKVARVCFPLGVVENFIAFIDKAVEQNPSSLKETLRGNGRTIFVATGSNERRQY